MSQPLAWQRGEEAIGIGARHHVCRIDFSDELEKNREEGWYVC